MRRLFIITVLLLLTNNTKAQLVAPKNSTRDTFYITRVSYNGTELHKKDWPAQYIVEDAVNIYIAEFVYTKGKITKDYFAEICDVCYEELQLYVYSAICNGTKQKVEIIKHPNDSKKCKIKYNIGDYSIDVSPNSSTEQTEEDVDQEIYQVVEVDPEFPGGVYALYEYVQNNLQYPQLAKKNKISGRVFVQFVIEPDGSISNVRVSRDIGGGCGTEAVRIVKSMPKWTPGKNRGKAVRTAYTLPVNFKLD